MPRVIYLQDLCSGIAGSEHELQDYEADTLIRMGVAELVNDDLLLNLNGTPVVGDFGDLIELSQLGNEQEITKKPSLSKNSKKK